MALKTLEKGNRWRALVCDLLAGLGHLTKRGIGEAGDDVVLRTDRLGELSIECKNEVRLDLAGWVNQAERQAEPGQLPIVIAHRARRAGAEDAYVVMPGWVLAELLRRAG